MSDTDSYPTPPKELKSRVTASLQTSGVLRRRTHWSWVPLTIAAGTALFLAGIHVGQRTPAGRDDAPTFALMLYEDTAFEPGIPSEEVVREYTVWASELAQHGALVLAEKLDPMVQVAGPEATADAGPLGRLTGMFVVRAEDRAAALELARGHPHVRYGGRIVVRAFVQRG